MRERRATASVCGKSVRAWAPRLSRRSRALVATRRALTAMSATILFARRLLDSVDRGERPGEARGIAQHADVVGHHRPELGDETGFLGRLAGSDRRGGEARAARRCRG